MKRNPLIFPALTAAAFSGLAPAAAADPADGSPGGKKPHIIFLMADQMRWDAMGCAGNPYIQTPNLDALAAEGNLFVNGYSSVPSSTPARSAILTGMSPWNHGMLGYGNGALTYKYEMPRMLAGEGYYTYGVGKMHWNPQNALHGFDTVLSDEEGRDDPKRRDTPDFLSDYHKWFQTKAPGHDPDITGIKWNAHAGRVYQLDESLHPTTWTAEMALSVIDNYTVDDPLFLMVSFARPHSPYDPPQRFYDIYENAEVPAPVKAEWSAHFADIVRDPLERPEAWAAGFDDEYVMESRRHYYGSVTFIDEKIGEIVAALKHKGMYDDALIVFVADHGDMLGDHNLWRKTYAYEGSAAIPFILKLPASSPREVPAGRKMEQPIELRDLLPTFLDAAGSEVPGDMDGRPLTSLIADADAPWREIIDLEHAQIYGPENQNWCALTDGKIKYIWFFPTGEEQLFDLSADPYEQRDLSGDRRYRRQLERFRLAMADHLSIRGEEWVKDGKPMVRSKKILYSPNFPAKK